MKKSHLTILILLFCAILTGCETKTSNHENESTPTPTNKPVQTDPTLSPTANTESVNKTENWLNSYPELHEFMQAKEWTKLTLISEGGDYQEATIPIKDPKLIELLTKILTNLKGEEFNSPFDLHNVYFLLEAGNKQYKVQVGNYGQVAFPDWYGTSVFGIRHNLLTIVDSLLKRPDYMPEAPFEEKLWDGGLLYIQEGDAEVYYSDVYRTRLVAQCFIQADKKQVKASASHPDKEDFLLKLYTHGGTIEFLVYADLNLVRVLDNDKENWYEMSPDGIQQMRFIYTAS